MSIRFYCPLGHRLQVPDARAGKKGRCPLCQQKIIVPVANPRASGKPKIGPGNAIALDEALASELGLEVERPPLQSPKPPRRPIDAPADGQGGSESSDSFWREGERPRRAARKKGRTTREAAKHADAALAAAPLAASQPEADSQSLSPGNLPPLPPAAPVPLTGAAPIPLTSAASIPAVKGTAPSPVRAPLPASATSWVRQAESTARGYRADASSRSTAYALAAIIVVVAILGVVPAARAAQVAPDPAWKHVVWALTALEMLYALWLASLPDWSTAWLGMIFTAGIAALYGAGLALVVSTPFTQPLVLGLTAVRNTAGGWCAANVLLWGILCYALGRFATGWKRSVLRLR